MNTIVGMLSIVAGFIVWGVAIFALHAWLFFWFGPTGVALLTFAPYILLAPLGIGTVGVALFFYGIDKIRNNKEL